MRLDQPPANPTLQWFCPHRMHRPLSECGAITPFFLNYINTSSRTVSGEADGSVGELLADDGSVGELLADDGSVVNCLPCNNEDLSSISRTNAESWAWRPLLIIPGLGRQERRPQSALASQASLMDELQSMRDPVLEEVGRITDEP